MAELPPLTRADLDAASCSTPHCTHAMHASMFLHPRCHPNAGTRVEYRRDGILRVRCRKCEALVANVQIADGPAAS